MQFPSETIWYYDIGGFKIHSHDVVDLAGIPMYRVDQWIVPYWVLAWPLTLLSVYLILWKPRKRACPN